ncbi:MAG: hypothetical protein KJ795_11150 [Gammaproteobacteria bacterium]|nr:hypothetical protein [Gammaproteobacteria bacterium]MBU1776792.1 hypothetical protein [Gammaproteobacteria bacterium]MBU1968577.1 hypothetical protein [Gammaproteobacteria bacterium]
MLSALVFVLLGLTSAMAEPQRVTVVLSETGGSYQAFGDLLRDKLQASGSELSIGHVGDLLRQGDLYIAVGMKAAVELADREAPVLNVFIPKSGHDRLLLESRRRGTSYSAIYLDQPPERQVALLRAVLPHVRKVGVLYSDPPPELPSVRKLLADSGLELNERKLDQRPLNDALESVLEESDVLMVLPDASVYNPGTIRNILLTAYRKQIPLVGISQAYVRAGALCAVYSKPEQIAEQAAAMIRRYAESGRLSAAQYPAEFEVSVNMQVARSLDLRIKDAAMLRAEVRGKP